MGPCFRRDDGVAKRCFRRNDIVGGLLDQIGGDGRRRHRAGDRRGDGRGAARGRPPVWSGAAVLAPPRSGLRRCASRAPPFRRPPCEAAQAADGVILGPVSHNDYPPVAEGGLNPSGELRKRLDLFANIRPAHTRGGFPPRCGTPVDLVIVRENTEGFYADRSMFLGAGEFMPTPDLALAVRKITRAGSHADRRGGVRARHAAAQEGDRGAQGQCAAGVGRAVPGMRARGGGALSGRSPTRSRSSTPWRRCWCATPASST